MQLKLVCWIFCILYFVFYFLFDSLEHLVSAVYLKVIVPEQNCYKILQFEGSMKVKFIYLIWFDWNVKNRKIGWKGERYAIESSSTSRSQAEEVVERRKQKKQSLFDLIYFHLSILVLYVHANARWWRNVARWFGNSIRLIRYSMFDSMFDCWFHRNNWEVTNCRICLLSWCVSKQSVVCSREKKNEKHRMYDYF